MDASPVSPPGPSIALPSLCRCSNIPADVYFLADNTGSMGGILGAVQAGAKDILDALQASPDVGDLHVGVGAYQDRGDPYVFNNIDSLTADTDAALAGIGTWTPGFGGDEPEGQLYALYKASFARQPRCGGLLAAQQPGPGWLREQVGSKLGGSGRMSKDALSHCTWLLLVLLALQRAVSLHSPMRTCVLGLHHQLNLTLTDSAPGYPAAAIRPCQPLRLPFRRFQDHCLVWRCSG